MSIHVIDENRAVGLMLSGLLQQLGFDVQLFDHAAHYLDYAASECYLAPAAIIADLRLSRLHFPAETRELCRRKGNVPWLMTSRVPELQPLIQHSASIPKPFAPVKLGRLLLGFGILPVRAMQLAREARLS